MVDDSVLNYIMEGINPMEVQNRLLTGVVGKRLYKMQTVSSEVAAIGTTAFHIRLKKENMVISIFREQSRIL